MILPIRSPTAKTIIYLQTYIISNLSELFKKKNPKIAVKRLEENLVNVARVNGNVTDLGLFL